MKPGRAARLVLAAMALASLAVADTLRLDRADRLPAPASSPAAESGVESERWHFQLEPGTPRLAIRSDGRVASLSRGTARVHDASGAVVGSHAVGTQSALGIVLADDGALLVDEGEALTVIDARGQLHRHQLAGGSVDMAPQALPGGGFVLARRRGLLLTDGQGQARRRFDLGEAQRPRALVPIDPRGAAWLLASDASERSFLYHVDFAAGLQRLRAVVHGTAQATSADAHELGFLLEGGGLRQLDPTTLAVHERSPSSPDLALTPAWRDWTLGLHADRLTWLHAEPAGSAQWKAEIAVDTAPLRLVDGGTPRPPSHWLAQAGARRWLLLADGGLWLQEAEHAPRRITQQVCQSGPPSALAAAGARAVVGCANGMLHAF